MISLVFLFKSVIPFVGLAELGLREWLAIEVATLFGFSLLPVFKATIFIYVVNIILPAIFGLLFLQQVTLTKELK